MKQAIAVRPEELVAQGRQRMVPAGGHFRGMARVATKLREELPATYDLGVRCLAGGRRAQELDVFGQLTEFSRGKLGWRRRGVPIEHWHQIRGDSHITIESISDLMLHRRLGAFASEPPQEFLRRIVGVFNDQRPARDPISIPIVRVGQRQDAFFGHRFPQPERHQLLGGSHREE